jgi:hypothetical protein
MKRHEEILLGDYGRDLDVIGHYNLFHGEVLIGEVYCIQATDKHEDEVASFARSVIGPGMLAKSDIKDVWMFSPII